MSEVVYFPFVQETNERMGVLLTASATTGWADWIHGELWLFPDGLLRIPLDIGITYLHGVGPTVHRKQRRWASFHDHTFASLFATKTCLWLPREQIRRGYLHRGFITDRLRLEMKDGRSVKLLWLPWDGAADILQTVLSEWLGDGLVLD